MSSLNGTPCKRTGISGCEDKRQPEEQRASRESFYVKYTCKTYISPLDVLN